MTKKLGTFIIISSFIFGAIGGWVFMRFVIPKLNTIHWLVKYNLAPSAGPLIINTRQEIRVNDGSDTIAAIKSAKPWVVGIFSAPDVNHVQLLGSGAVLSSDGLIATTKSVVEAFSAGVTIQIKFMDGKTLPATLTASDPSSNLVFLKVSGQNLATAPLSIPKDMQLGQKLIVISPSLEQNEDIDDIGYLRSEVQNIDLNSIYFSDQISQTFTVGGTGPLFEGSVVTSNDANVQGLYSNSGIITADTIKSATDSYFNSGKIVRNAFGFHYQYLSNTAANLFGLPEGITVRKPDSKTPAVVAGQPAAQAGLLEGDIIYEVNGTQINFDNSFEQLTGLLTPGSTLTLSVMRGKQSLQIKLISKAK